MEQKQTDVVIKTLIEKQTTISTMESCTSGLIASMITDTEGASAIFVGKLFYRIYFIKNIWLLQCYFPLATWLRSSSSSFSERTI